MAVAAPIGLAGGDHLERLGKPDEPRKALRAARAGKDAELHLRQTALRVARCHPVVAREGDLETSAERRAVDGRHDGLFARLVARDHRAEVRGLRRLAELRDVRPRDECPAAAHEDDGLDSRLGDGLGQAVEQPLAHLLAERVDGRAVDRDYADLAALLERHDFAHGQTE